ncbi:hypothetical protein Pan216_35880 [Planctomycetes bacterium Pan216]|uniref:Uncharacterized protein n=2 Tax=Kolteria novifilia TaxID=2527975 RepID=A0A518B6W3_9BACT|nr:hypothetical protein Pan216_35880 [Planctomycetes bacterium Pan216]
MEFLATLPPWQIGLLIFGIRIIDVSLGTLRTIFVVQGRLAISVVLGFFEVLVWIVALSQVIIGVSDSPLLVLAYAGGFAAGNAAGIGMERLLALGFVVVRIISEKAGPEIAETLRRSGFRATMVEGHDRVGPVMLIYSTCQRRRLSKLLAIVDQVEPNVFFSVEPVHQHNEPLTQTLPYPTGWAALFKKK